MIKHNIMTAYTKTVLEKAFCHAREELHRAQLAIGEAAGKESDWHDNSAFDFANTEYDLCSVRLANLTNRLRIVEIIAPRQQTNEADIGNSIVVKFEGEQEEEIFTILGPDDSGRKQGWLSYLSPLGKSLIGKKVGENAEYSMENGEKQIVRVIKILPGNFE